MRYAFLAVLIIIAIEGANYAAIGLSNPDGAIHEIEGLIGLLVLAVVAGALYVGAVVDTTKPPRPPKAGKNAE